jgi:FkbM family methyltransferase
VAVEMEVIASFKSLVKSSPVYPALKEWRTVKAMRAWGAEDSKRLQFYQHLIKPNDLVFDIGANVGNRTKVFLRLGARVVAFEPQPFCAKVLGRAFSGNARFQLVHMALGGEAGKAELQINNADVLSSMSQKWIRSTEASGRFTEGAWTERVVVPVTTLDAAILKFGSPAFVKIDVEGFESQVLSGLSQPIQSGSIEFAAEALEETLFCLERLAGFQETEFQYSASETMQFDWPGWMNLEKAQNVLATLASVDMLAWGDVYFRLRTR